MNNYLSINLVNGKLGRLAGGGKPKFILDEQNEVQLYILDFPKPSTYPPDSLADAYAYEIVPRNFNSSSVTLNAGIRGGNAIISTSSFFNLPTNIAATSNSSISYTDIVGPVEKVVYNTFFSVQPSPSLGSLFSFNVSISGGTISYSTESTAFSFDNSLLEIKKILAESIVDASNNFHYNFITSLAGSIGDLTSNIYQVSDYSYSFSAFQTLISIAQPPSVSFNVTLNNINAFSSPGKYGYLDFSSSSWDSIIGTRTEAPIWMEARIGSDTIAQGNAIICRKMT